MHATFRVLNIVTMSKLKLLSACFLINVSALAWSQQTKLPSEQLLASGESTLAVNDNLPNSVCTVLAADFEWLTLTAVISIYSTYKIMTDCDQDYFDNITMASIGAQMKIPSNSILAIRGGAQSYLMDVNLTPVLNPYFYIGNLRFSLSSKVRISLKSVIDNKIWKIASIINNFYTPFSIESPIHYIWNIGSLTHTLIAPNGDRYILYAFSNEVAKDLTRKSLLELGQRLNLPVGWVYENSLISQTITIRATANDAYTSKVIFDEFGNYYVKYISK